MKKSATLGMTLIEVIITFMVLVLLATVAIILINPKEQLSKARDTRRKNDLNEIRKIFESWYSDTGCYPKKSEICFNDISSTTCEICTSDPASPSLSTYTSSVLCDPEAPDKQYLYQFGGSADCPASFVVYSRLTSTYNRQDDIWSCGPVHGCGPSPLYGYDYLVCSPDARLSIANDYHCLDRSGYCTSCGTYQSCENAMHDDVCRIVYASKTLCCASNPSAGYCP
ncbi:MAG: prepilin-type N-terminal cleavage/methylation domain-containing protein [Patescibacteria group bacterium]